MAHKNKKKPQKNRTHATGRLGIQTAGNPGPLATAVSIGVSLAVMTSLAFLSPELALIGLALSALTFFVLFDRRHRSLWELAASDKFRVLKARQQVMDREISRNREEISNIKAGLYGGETESKVKTEKPVLLTSPLETKNPPFATELKKTLSQKPGNKAAHPIANAAAPKRPTPGPARTRTRKPFATSIPKAANDPAAKPVDLDLEAPPSDNSFEDFDALSDIVVQELLSHAIKNKRVDLFIQPVMRLPQRRVLFFEMFARIRARPGLYVPASRYMSIARQNKIIENIDTLALIECLKILRDTAHLRRPAPVFLNIAASTLKDMRFMEQLLGFLARNKTLAPRLIFEITQAAYESMPPALLEIVKALGKLGCTLSLDHVKNLECDIGDLLRFKVRFMKIRASVLVEAARSETAFTDMQRLKRQLENNGIAFIVERIETEHELREVLDYDVHYGQGYLFSKPALQGAYGSRRAA